MWISAHACHVGFNKPKLHMTYLPGFLGGGSYDTCVKRLWREGEGRAPSGPDTRPCCHPRGTWWLSAHTRASCRSGMPLRGRSCPCWKATRRVSVRSHLGARVGLCCGARPHPQSTLYLATGALAWNADQLSSGSRDRMILQRDIRTPPLQSERRLQGHRQEVCGLKWSTDHQLLASGGNDNKVGQPLAPCSPLCGAGVMGVCRGTPASQPHSCSCWYGTTRA